MLYKFSILKPKDIESKKAIKNAEKLGNNIEIVFNTDHPQDLKKFLNKLGLVILSTSKFEGEIENFGIIKFTLEVEDLGKIEGYLPTKSTAEAIAYIQVLDLEKFITHIDNIKTPFDENKIVKILNLLKQQQITTKTAKKQTKKPTEERKELKQIREFIDEVINDGKQVIQTHRRWVSPVKIKRLEDALGELLKLKRSTNIEKLTKLLEDTLSLMEQIELESINRQKEIEKNKIKEDILPDFDILLEIEKYKKAQKIKKVKNISPSLHERFYQFFGKIGLYLVLLFKELKLKLYHLDKYTLGFVNYIELFFIFTNIRLVFYLIYFAFLQGYSPKDLSSLKHIANIFYYLVIFNIFAFVFYFAKFLVRKNNFKLFLAVLAGSLVIGFILEKLILATFALPM